MSRPSDGLAVFRDPASVAVVGASADPAKWGYWLAAGALRGAGRRAVHLVNSRGGVIAGQHSVPSLNDLAQPPELVVLCVPPRAAEAVVDQALALGVRGFLGITAGIDQEFPGAEQRLAERIRAGGARLVGPGCLGLFDAETELSLLWGRCAPGSVGIVSQSGQLGLELAGLAGAAGLGVSRFVSVGAQRDVTAVEVLTELASHQRTEVVLLYLESFRSDRYDGRQLVDALSALRECGKPVIMLTAGASAAGSAAVRSHTGALASSAEVVDAAARAAGAVVAQTPVQAVDLALLLRTAPRIGGRRVAVVGDSGGQGALAADLLTASGMRLPRLTEATASGLAALLPRQAAVANPVDLAGGGEQDLTNYARVIDRLLVSGEIDALLLTGYFGCYGTDLPGLLDAEVAVAQRIGAAAVKAGLPVVVHSMAISHEVMETLQDKGIATYSTIDAASRALGQATEWAARAPRPLASPPAASPVSTSGYWSARELLDGLGIRFPAGALVTSRTGALAAAARLRGPFALKADWIEHKTESAAVVLGLADPVSIVAAYDRLVSRLGNRGYVVEELDDRSPVVELIVGIRRDPAFGPVVLVGLGGTTAEVYRDVAIELAPVSQSEAEAMVRRLRGWPLLAGWRGGPALDVRAAAEVVVALSRFALAHPELTECEVNPVRVGVDGAVAVDAIVVTG